MDNTEKLNKVFNTFKIAATCTNFFEYKNACFYDVELQPGTRIRDVEKYLNELSFAMRIPGKPALKILSDKGLLRFEFLKPRTNKVDLFQLGYGLPRPNGKLTCLIGETPEGLPLWFDIVSNPHMLVAGCTGSGKSTILHTLIANLLLYPRVSIILMDPKNIEFYKYSDMQLDRIKVTYAYDECLEQLEKLCLEMDERYQLIREFKVTADHFPYIVLIIDEFADLIQQDVSKQFHAYLCRLAQKSRAAGIHLIISTQRPSVDVVDGTIKANFPSRISCKVATGVDSRVILDATGAQNLLGCGDSILKSSAHDWQRFQAAFTSPDEIKKYFGSK